MKAGRNRRQAPLTPDTSSALPVRQLRWAGAAALSFGAITAAILSWERWFPPPPEKLIEVVWTHECHCAAGWIDALRREGFTVRDFEMDDLRVTRRKWQVPNAAQGCHPARYLGYLLDGHLSAEAMRRLAREHPPALGVVQGRRAGRGRRHACSECGTALRADRPRWSATPVDMNGRGLSAAGLQNIDPSQSWACKAR